MLHSSGDLVSAASQHRQVAHSRRQRVQIAGDIQRRRLELCVQTNRRVLVRSISNVHARQEQANALRTLLEQDSHTHGHRQAEVVDAQADTGQARARRASSACRVFHRDEKSAVCAFSSVDVEIVQVHRTGDEAYENGQVYSRRLETFARDHSSVPQNNPCCSDSKRITR